MRLASVGVFLAMPLAAMARSTHMRLNVDARDVTHGIQKVHLELPVHPGPVTLFYPKWVRGEHAANGPVTQVMNLHFWGGDRQLAWKRDDRNAFAFHLMVPERVHLLCVDFDFFSPPQSFASGFGTSPNTTPNQVVLLFSQFVLYPRGVDLSRSRVETTLMLPEQWRNDCAVPSFWGANGRLHLISVSLATLMDSPLIAGKFFRTFPIKTGSEDSRISITADDASDLLFDAGPLQERLEAVLSETSLVFGEQRQNGYVWLVSLANSFTHDGTEHGASADIREADSLFTAPSYQIEMRLFPHEYVHVWNGIKRRPFGLVDPDLEHPMRDDLLWLYEGLTRYYGDLVLSARSGLTSADDAKAYLAFVAAQMADDRPGRLWRPLADTTIAEPTYENAPRAWTAVRRGADYYNEMLLIWLEVDTKIRELSRGRKSLDDFCRRFFGGRAETYTRSSVIATLRSVVPYDWSSFLHRRIDELNPSAPLSGLEKSGWKLTFSSEPNPFMQKLAVISKTDDLSFSVGLWLSPTGVMEDVLPGSAAFNAGLVPGQQIAEINGQPWSQSLFDSAVEAAAANARSIDLKVSSNQHDRAVSLDYHGGVRYPHLARDAEHQDTLQRILHGRRTDGQSVRTLEQGGLL